MFAQLAGTVEYINCFSAEGQDSSLSDQDTTLNNLMASWLGFMAYQPL